MDKKILFAFIEIAHKYKIVRFLSGVFFKAASTLFFCLYTFTGLYLIFRDDHRLFLYICVPLTCLLTGSGLRWAIKKPRPYQEHGYQPDGDISRESGYSFPSNHSLSSMVIAFACLFVYGPIGVAAVLLAVSTGLSRIFMGVHYFSDVAAGWLLGLLFGVIGFYPSVLHIIG